MLIQHKDTKPTHMQYNLKESDQPYQQDLNLHFHWAQDSTIALLVSAIWDDWKCQFF